MEQQICQDYQNGLRGRRLAQKYQMSPTTIYKILRQQQVTVRDCSRRKYQLDETVFDKIDCEWKAYFLGLFYADGCVQKNKTLKIGLHEKDKEILEIINARIFPNNPLRYEPAREYKGRDGKPRHNSAKYYFNINSQKIWNQFQSFGCSQRKSLTLKLPANVISHSLMPHFLRGYFDGDGGIVLPTVWHIISSQTFCLDIQRYLYDTLGIVSHYSVAKKNGRLKVHKKTDNRKLYNYLYEGATIFLKRKKEKFKKIFI